MQATSERPDVSERTLQRIVERLHQLANGRRLKASVTHSQEHRAKYLAEADGLELAAKVVEESL